MRYVTVQMLTGNGEGEKGLDDKQLRSPARIKLGELRSCMYLTTSSALRSESKFCHHRELKYQVENETV